MPSRSDSAPSGSHAGEICSRSPFGIRQAASSTMGRLVSSGAVRIAIDRANHMSYTFIGRASSNAMRPSRIIASTSLTPDHGIMR